MALDGYLCVLRDENQVYARIDRMGNRDPRVITYLGGAQDSSKVVIKTSKVIIWAVINATVLEWLRALEE